MRFIGIIPAGVSVVGDLIISIRPIDLEVAVIRDLPVPEIILFQLFQMFKFTSTPRQSDCIAGEICVFYAVVPSPCVFDVLQVVGEPIPFDQLFEMDQPRRSGLRIESGSIVKRCKPMVKPLMLLVGENLLRPQMSILAWNADSFGNTIIVIIRIRHT